MYKVIGSDGKEYGPISLEQLRQWRTEGRINARTRVLGPGATEWKTASEFPELGLTSPPGIPGAGVSAQPPSLPAGEQKGLAIASFVLGLGVVIALRRGAGVGNPGDYLRAYRPCPGAALAGGVRGCGFCHRGFCAWFTAASLMCLAGFGLYSASTMLLAMRESGPSPSTA